MSTSTKPTRYQRSRAKGWRKPEGAIIVTRPSKFGNPYKVIRLHDGWHMLLVGTRTRRPHIYSDIVFDTQEEALDFVIRCFRGLVKVSPIWQAYLRELKGKDLVCWCGLSKPCHADVLIELANT